MTNDTDLVSDVLYAEVTSRPIRSSSARRGEPVMAGLGRAMPRARKTEAAKRPTWSDVKAHLAPMDRTGLMALIRDLYNLDALNRRALHARFTSDGTTVEQYRRLVRTAVFPDPLSQRPVRLRDATATIRQYTRPPGM
jgi:hypothetical protein